MSSDVRPTATRDPRAAEGTGGRSGADDAKAEASSVVDTAKGEAGKVTEVARREASGLATDARQQLRDQAQRQTDQLGQTMRGVAERLEALSDGRPEDAGQVNEMAQNVAGQMQHLSERIEELGFEGTLDEIQRFARRRPGAFLAGAAALGFAASRLARGAKEDQQGGTSSGQGGGIGSRSEGDRPALPPTTDAPRAVPSARPPQPQAATTPVRGQEGS